MCLFLSEMAQKDLDLAEVTEKLEKMRDEEKRNIIELMELKHSLEESKLCSLRTSETCIFCVYVHVSCMYVYIYIYI